jgi:hypothetical protein
MRYYEIIREDVAQEISSATKAMNAFQVFGNHVLNADPSTFRTAIFDGQRWFMFDATPPGISTVVNVPNLLILIGKKNPRARGMSGGAQTGRITLGERSYTSILYMECLTEMDPTQVSRCVNSVEFMKIFRHEVVHLIDSRRTSGRIFSTSGYDAFTDKTSYYNDPAELNGYFHTIGDPFLTVYTEIDDWPLEEITDFLSIYNMTGQFEEDIKILISSLDRPEKEFFKHLTERNKRSIMKRLYRVHEAIRDKIAKRQAETV